MLCPNLMVTSKSLSMHLVCVQMKLLLLPLKHLSVSHTDGLSHWQMKQKCHQVSPLTCAVSCAVTAQVSVVKLNPRTIFVLVPLINTSGHGPLQAEPQPSPELPTAPADTPCSAFCTHSLSRWLL